MRLEELRKLAQLVCIHVFCHVFVTCFVTYFYVFCVYESFNIVFFFISQPVENLSLVTQTVRSSMICHMAAPSSTFSQLTRTQKITRVAC